MTVSHDQSPLLRMEKIGKSFGDTRVLHDVDFEVRAGEVHILAGENGAGKSTLIKILAGVHADYAGRILLQDTVHRFRSPQDAAAHGISVIYQELSLIPSMSVADNIFLGREKSGPFAWMRFGNQRAACRELLQRLELNVDPGRFVEEYPIPVQQMIEIAKALAFDARIIVMDEPTSALTEPEVERLFAIIAQLKAAGCGIIYISHKMEEIYRIADRITVLRDGVHVGTAPTAELPRAKLIHWMVGREISEQFPRHASTLKDERLRVEHFTVPDPGGLPRPAVDDVSFAVRGGEILGIAGLQGSGNSTLFAGLFGAYGRKVRGEVLLDGKTFSVRSPRHAITHGLGYLTNDRKTSGLVLEMDIVKNITLASIPQYSPGLWLRIRAASLYQHVGSLSGGNQQKVVLAKWLEIGPKVLLLDEPTRGVDVGAKHEIYELMNTWTNNGIAVVLITSEMPELLAMSDRILVMHRGRITAQFTAEEATQEAILDAAMGLETVVR